jgi:hypothetical protein
MSIEADFRHLLALCHALRLAQKGNLATGEKPDKEAAARLTTALDVFIATHDRREQKAVTVN